MTDAAALVLADAAAADRLGRALGQRLAVGDVVTLAGDLGAGKTTLARGVLAGLGYAGEVPSPSFALAIAYQPPELRLPLLHADLYRLRGADELAELGLDDARAEAALLVEWPDRAGPAAWPDALRLHLAPAGGEGAGGGRRLTWIAPAAWDGRWPPARP